MCGELLSTHEFIIYLNTSLYRWYPIGIVILGALTFTSPSKVKAWFLHFVWMYVQSFIKTQKKILEKIKKMSTHSPADQWRVDPCWASALVAENTYFSWKCRDFNWSMQIVNTGGSFNDWLIQQFTELRHQFISVSICQSQRIRFREYQRISFRFLIMEILKLNRIKWSNRIGKFIL